MDKQMVAAELVRIAESLTAGSTVGSRVRLLKSVTTKGGAQFADGEELRIAEYTKEYPYRVRLEGEGGKSLRVPVDVAWRVLSGFPKPPSTATLNKWSMDGVAKAIDGARVEPDGHSPSGAPSWLLVVGVI